MASAPVTLAERLGYSAEDVLVIINADDFGMNHSANLGISSLLAERRISSATLMPPCAWAPEAAQISRENPGFDVGLHFTLTSEWAAYRWRPLTAAASLVDDSGYMPPKILHVEQHATGEDVRAELHAQVAHLRGLGVDISHIDNHMGSVYGIATGRSFLRETLETCAEYHLPFRLPRYAETTPDGLAELEQSTAEVARLADSLGVVIPDRLATVAFHNQPEDSPAKLEAEWTELIENLKPGVTEIYLHPFVETSELRASVRSWERRVMEHALFAGDAIGNALERRGARVITWRDLRDLQRGERG
ncbi:ChbG/HpnK family deacetylase [Mycetocola tolaasinivorans]|uniref:ChbG/HpnK family deacetylase n=1 Tax=Mycetocola tolaasinivorans TaxID=76635 RepID=A0A3L7A4Z6_9MICO|nr:polysaccharide deacetylase family protein [Mycetocola tolaasinivorans]RLP75297.1 ChbG/HpnK family deacetylase [Mycetocola tolaasinivorans]